MAVLSGDQGSVKFDVDGAAAGAAAAIIAGTRSWSLSVTKDTIDGTAQGDTFRTNVGSFVSGSGTVELVYNTGQTTQTTFFAEVLNSNDTADATFELFTTGTTANTNSISFSGIITSFDVSSTAGDIVVATCNFVTSGAIAINL